MTCLQSLRNAPWLARLALLWFALTLGVAVASPMVNPQEELVICSSAGMVKVKLNADGSLSTEPSADVHCPLCLVGVAAPPGCANLQATPPQALRDVLNHVVGGHLAAATAALPPARAPPVLR